jgi:predicted nucleic acid-binding protein
VTAVFVDTGALYALADAGESTHSRARATLAALGREGRALLTTTDVVDEIVTLARYRLGHAPAVSLGERLFRSKWCRVVEVPDDIRAEAWKIFVRYDDQRFSLTDCTSFATMHARHLVEAFTFDRTDFLAAGFSVVPDPNAPAPRRTRRR